MAIRPRYSSVSEFPAAKLYLDDIERIVEILRASVPESLSKPGSYGANASPAWASFRFVTDENECDSVSELREVGTVVHDLRIIGQWFDLQIKRDGAAIAAVGREGIEAELRGRLLPIFEARRRRGPIAWLSNDLFVFLLFALGVILWEILVPSWAESLVGSRAPRTQGAIRVLAEGLPALVCLLFTAMAIGGVGPRLSVPSSTVVLRRAREPKPDAERWIPHRHELVKMTITALLGWLLGIISILLFQRK